MYGFLAILLAPRMDTAAYPTVLPVKSILHIRIYMVIFWPNIEYGATK
jgi:hypothetical protein